MVRKNEIYLSVPDNTNLKVSFMGRIKAFKISLINLRYFKLKSIFY